MVLTEGPTLEATGVESAPTTAVHRRSEERRTALDFLSSRDTVQEAHKLVTQVVCILDDPICEERSNLAFRLARAQVLTLLDHLANMLDPR